MLLSELLTLQGGCGNVIVRNAIGNCVALYCTTCTVPRERKGIKMVLLCPRQKTCIVHWPGDNSSILCQKYAIFVLYYVQWMNK